MFVHWEILKGKKCKFNFQLWMLFFQDIRDGTKLINSALLCYPSTFPLVLYWIPFFDRRLFWFEMSYVFYIFQGFQLMTKRYGPFCRKAKVQTLIQLYILPVCTLGVPTMSRILTGDCQKLCFSTLTKVPFFSAKGKQHDIFLWRASTNFPPSTGIIASTTSIGSFLPKLIFIVWK